MDNIFHHPSVPLLKNYLNIERCHIQMSDNKLSRHQDMMK